MTRLLALKILNPILLILLVFQIVSGLNPLLVPYKVHQDVGILIGCGILLHLTLNWNWIRINILRRK
jgi:hypothetical protein